MKPLSYTAETGITPTVHTYFSGYSILNLIEIICDKKVNAIDKWLKSCSIKPRTCLIIGSYLTGMRLANFLCHTCQVTVLDICNDMQGFLDPRVSFTSSYEQTVHGVYDCIIDTSGLGGISPDEITRYRKPEAFIVEDPCSDGSDICILGYNRSNSLISSMAVKKSGVIRTFGLGSKTSGTMSLTLEVIRAGMNEALMEEGVLYSSSHVDFFERIIFKEKNPEKFFTSLNRSALVISSLKMVDPDAIIERNLYRIQSLIDAV